MSLATQLSTMLGSGEPTKASLICEEASDLSIGDVAFNPESLVLTRGTVWGEGDNGQGPWGSLNYVSGTADTLTMKLLLDQSEYRPSTLLGRSALAIAPVGDALSYAVARLMGWVNSDSVTLEMRMLYGLTLPVKATTGCDIQGQRPPVVLFSWGDFSFRGVLSKLDFTIDMFDDSGNPRRATADLTLTGRPSIGSEDDDIFNDQFEPDLSSKASASTSAISDPRTYALLWW